MGTPRPKPGQIKAAYGRLDGDRPDLIVASNSTSRSDRSLVMHHLAPLFRELVNRGYDPRSLRFSIERTPQRNEPT